MCTDGVSLAATDPVDMRLLLNTAFGLQPKPTTSIVRIFIVRIFIGWLQCQIDRRHFRVNAGGGIVHRCADGVLIRSPAVFKAFVEDRAIFAMCQTADMNDWKKVQRVFLRRARKLMSSGKSKLRTFRISGHLQLSGYVLAPGVVQLPMNCQVNPDISETMGKQS